MKNASKVIACLMSCCLFVLTTQYTFAASCAQAAAESMEQVRQNTEPEEELQNEIYLIYMALSSGLETVDAHIYTETQTELDKQILEFMDIKIPATLNKITKSLSEVEEELFKQSTELAKLVIKNQTLYPEPKNWELAGKLMAASALQYAITSQKIEEGPMNILRQEAMKLWQNLGTLDQEETK